MKIERAVLREIPLTLARPFQSSAGVVRERRVLLLTLEGEGAEGWAECVAPGVPYYTYESTGTAWHMLTDFLLPTAVGANVAEPGDVLLAASRLKGHPMAKATLEMAAWDMAARQRGLSLAETLGGTRRVVEVGVSLGMMATDQLVRATEEQLEDGYTRVKVKVGPGRDVEVLAALRERFPAVALWADANSAYSLEDADHLREFDSLDIQMLEEPLAAGDLVRSAELQSRISTPICLDESILDERDLEAALELGSCRVVNLKPGRVGGFVASLGIYETLLEAGIPMWCGGMLETGIGRAHNVALASLAGFTLPGDISASRRYWMRDIVTPELEVSDGTMAVPSGPGIGVEIDVDRIEALTTRVARFG